MARLDAAGFKSALAAVAAALTAGYADDTDTGAALAWSDPRQQLRDLNKLFIADSAGTFTINNALIDQIYAGNKVANPKRNGKYWNAPTP